METVSPESNTTPNNSQLDHIFDLDLALTMELQDYNNSSQGIKVSGSLISSPPQKNISSSSSSASPESEMMVTINAPVGVCTVCMEGFQSSAGSNTVKIGKQVPCGHVYHSTCISTWLSLHDSCPLCRCKISGHRKISPSVSA